MSSSQLLCAKHHLMGSSSQGLAILQMKKKKNREVTQHFQGHLAKKHYLTLFSYLNPKENSSL